MTKYAVIRINGKQYKVSEGEEILVDRVTGNKPLVEVLLMADGEKVVIGKPLVKGKIDLKKVEDLKGDKLDILKYKAKSRYRRKMGFRQQLSKLQVGKISSS